MAKEILAVPEDNLEEVIEIIEAGMKAVKKISRDTKENLQKWCKEEREYLERLKE